MKGKLILITGMHRSGTSALARVFVKVGFDAGSNLIQPDENNPLGYWEDFDVFNLNNQILSHLFLSWDKIENLENRRIHIFRDEIIREFEPVAFKILHQKLTKSQHVVIKDPRFTVLMPFWNKIFEQLEAEIFHFHIFRHPMLVAKSLQRRNGMSFQNGLLLWYYYNMSFLNDSIGKARFISYENLLEQSPETIDLLSFLTGIVKSQFNLSESLDSPNYNYLFSDKEKELLTLNFPKIEKLWIFLNNLQKDKELSADKEILNGLMIPVLSKFKKSDENRTINANLLFTNGSTKESGSMIIKGKQTQNSSFLFDFNGNKLPVNQFVVYVNEEPCRIKNVGARIITEVGTISLIPDSGNYVLFHSHEYYFNSNLPYFRFQMPQKGTIQKVEFLCEINENDETGLLFSISNLNEKNALLSKINLETQNKFDSLNEILKNTTALLEQVKQQAEIAEQNYHFQINQRDLEIYELKTQREYEKLQFEKQTAGLKVEIDRLNIQREEEKQQFEEQSAGLKVEIERLNIQREEEKQLFEEQIARQAAEIDGLEKKSLWLFTEFNEAKSSLSWKITTPLRKMQQFLTKVENKLFILKNDAGASYRLLCREGLAYFLFRMVWYIRGKRLKEEIEFTKSNHQKSTIKIPTTVDASKVLLFPKTDSPLVSIVIPVFNNFGMTYRCLKSILKNTTDLNYEIIIIDDNSTETGFDFNERCIGIHMIQNPENLGFLSSCNRGSAVAKGKYICFLNNDTEVHPGWLRKLVDLMDAREEIALAGPKLVYPDGRLQEAGGIIWNDASAWNYGKYDDTEKPDYNYLKEVDYISGACLLVRKSVWEELEGFDTQFIPAYYEDTDLAMRVRKLGFKVYYQPLSVVTHYEGISNGCDEHSGIKKYQTINQQKFCQKWSHELQVDCSPNGINVFFHRDHSLHQKHLLVIDHYVPMYDQDAGSRSTFSYLKLFVKMGFKIHFIGDNYFKHEPYTMVLQQMGIEVLCGNYYQKNIRDWFRENGRYIDFVIAHRIHIAPKYFDMIRKFTTAKIAYVGHDLQYLGSLRKFEVTGDKKFKKESAKFLQAETGIFNTVDVILPFSTYEEPYIKKLAPEKTVQVIPVYFFENIPDKVPGFDERRDILFVGYFGHPPNPDAILWFVKEVFPLVQQNIPDVKLHVVGSQPAKEVLGLQSDFIKVTGYVSDEELIHYYRKCKVAILPLRFGAGVKGKLLESLYHQIPTVITSVAAEGVPEIEHYSMIADNAGDFAENIRLLYQDKNVWKKYSMGGKELIEKCYTEEAAKNLLNEVFTMNLKLKLIKS